MSLDLERLTDKVLAQGTVEVDNPLYGLCVKTKESIGCRKCTIYNLEAEVDGHKVRACNPQRVHFLIPTRDLIKAALRAGYEHGMSDVARAAPPICPVCGTSDLRPVCDDNGLLLYWECPACHEGVSI